MDDFKISIVVPVYNVELYLERCIDSLLIQTYKNIEIILINDGSTDNSSIICERYKKMDNRIKVIHKKNGGLSAARNTGVKNATGEYILFVDSDDYIEKNTCERFIFYLKNNKGIKIVIGNAYRIENNQKLEMRHKNKSNEILSGKEFLKNELETKSMYMAAWLNLYNKEFLETNNLYFANGLLHEDEEFTPRVFLKADKVLTTNFIFYYYIIRNNSITTNKNLKKNAESIVEICRKLEKIYDELNDGCLKKLLKDNLVTKYLYAFQIGELYKYKKRNLEEFKFLLRNTKDRKNIFKVILFLISKKIYFEVNKFCKMR